MRFKNGLIKSGISKNKQDKPTNRIIDKCGLMLSRQKGQSVFISYEKPDGTFDELKLTYYGLNQYNAANLGFIASKKFTVVREELKDTDFYKCDKSITVHYKDGIKVR